MEVGFERHGKDWPAFRSNENFVLPPLTRVAGGWHDVLVLTIWGPRGPLVGNPAGGDPSGGCSGEGHKGES